MLAARTAQKLSMGIFFGHPDTLRPPQRFAVDGVTLCRQIAAELCVYTNNNFTVHSLEVDDVDDASES